MKTNLLKLIAIIFSFLLMVSCSEDEDSLKLGGSQSPMGEVNNEFGITNIPGISNPSIVVTGLTDGVSTVRYSGTITNDSYLSMIKSMTNVTASGNTVERECRYRITKDGMESVYDEGKCILVKYSAKVGDVYSLDRGTTTLRREVTEVSKEDNYYWNGMYIKTIEVKETGQNIPGVDHLFFRFNHKFGIVGLKVVFEDGTSTSTGIVSDSSN